VVSLSENDNETILLKKEKKRRPSLVEWRDE
jgi:hypothetical protein